MGIIESIIGGVIVIIIVAIFKRLRLPKIQSRKSQKRVNSLSIKTQKMNTEKKTENKLPKHLLAAFSYTKISLALLIAGFGILLLFILKAEELGTNGIIDRVYFILLIPFALSSVLILFKVVGAEAWFEGKVCGGTLKLGGSAAVFALIMVIGFKLLPDVKPFDFTIVLRDSSGKTVLKKQGRVKIILNGNTVTKKIDDNGSVCFKPIPSSFQNISVPVELDAKGWQFNNSKPSISCKLKGNNVILIIERDDSLCCISGKIKDSNGNFVVGAKVIIKDISTTTDKNGWFKLKIPKEKQNDEQMLSVQKEGYITFTSPVYPAIKGDIKITLERK